LKLNEAIDVALPYSKCPRPRLAARAEAIRNLDIDGIEGDIVECGVWRGGGVMLARLLSPRRVVWLYDTFTGMANRSKYDKTRGGHIMREGKAAATVAEVLANLNATNVSNGQYIRMVIGLIEETLLIKENVPDKIAFLHLDTDWYYSTKTELEILWPRVSRNGVMIVDDYGHWQGAKRAVDEFFPATRHSKIKLDQTAIMMIKG
jgi:O-methyltransferase